uniref:Cell growth-regulating nucleolar protein-like winged helix domain-containing protein n=1 Tax=Chrysotila carterae TaxID=13221 RepID=A0A7S4B1M8_CHRCT
MNVGFAVLVDLLLYVPGDDPACSRVVDSWRRWKHHIKATLQQAENRELPFKEVRKLVLKDYKTTVGATKFQKDDCRKEFKRKVAEMATVEKAGGMLRFRAGRND